MSDGYFKHFLFSNNQWSKRGLKHGFDPGHRGEGEKQGRQKSVE